MEKTFGYRFLWPWFKEEGRKALYKIKMEKTFGYRFLWPWFKEEGRRWRACHQVAD